MVPEIYGKSFERRVGEVAMKKSFRLFLITLIIAVVISTVGVAVVRHHDVSYGDMYEVLSKGISFGEPVYNYEPPEKTDMSGFAALTSDDTVMYQLNEFNTIETQLEYCTAEIVGGLEEDVLSVSMSCLDEDIRESTVFNTAVKDGRLYIQNRCSGRIPASMDRIKIVITIPDDYKGGYTITAEKSDITVANTESTMDMGLSLHNCRLSAENISAENISAELGSTSAAFKSVSGVDSVSISAVSSNINIGGIDTQYTKTVLSSTTFNAENISGSFGCDSDTSRLSLKYDNVSGNINLKANKGTINIIVPKNSSAALRRDERLSVFNNHTDIKESEKNNKDLRYIIETNVEFTIVTLDEK